LITEKSFHQCRDPRRTLTARGRPVELTADTTGPAARTEAAELRGPMGMFEREPFAGAPGPRRSL
jgi:hypothetical protein